MGGITVLVDWIALLTIPVAFLVWCICELILNIQYMRTFKETNDSPIHTLHS